MPNFLIYPILLTIIASYIRLNNNTLLSSHPLIYILLHIESALMVSFPSLSRNIYSVFPVKSTIMAKEIRLNGKQVRISPRFAYTEYKVHGAIFKSATLDLRQKSIKRTIEYHKRFCSIYVQQSRLQNLEGVLFIEPISLDDMNSQPCYKLQIDDEQLQKLGNITLLSFTIIAA